MKKIITTFIFSAFCLIAFTQTIPVPNTFSSKAIKPSLKPDTTFLHSLRNIKDSLLNIADSNLFLKTYNDSLLKMHNESLLRRVNFQIDSAEKATVLTASKLNIINTLPILAISGLGNISSAAQDIKVDPTANIALELRLSSRRQFKIYGLYNLGTNLDSSVIDSIQLASLFFPDKSKSGFSLGFSYDIFRGSKHIPNMEKICLYDTANANRFYFITGEPYLEYSYFKKNIKGSDIEIPRIETSTWLLGFRLGAQITSDKNTFGLSISPYYKWATVIDATYNTYNSLFKKSNNNTDLSQYAYFFGVNVNFQINKTILGFTYEDLTKGKIYNNNIKGGVFILKATIAADFFNF